MNTQTTTTEQKIEAPHIMHNAAIESPPIKKNATKLFAWLEDAAGDNGTLISAENYTDLRKIIADHTGDGTMCVRMIMRGRTIPFGVKTEIEFWKKS